jgi:uncharacterized membrane protein
MYPGHGFGAGWFGWLVPILLLALLVAGGIALFALIRRPSPPVPDDDPLRRAARRYAAGEIERVEFDRIRRDLGGPADDPLRLAARRLANGEIDLAEFDAVRERLGGKGPEVEDMPGSD